MQAAKVGPLFSSQTTVECKADPPPSPSPSLRLSGITSSPVRVQSSSSPIQVSQLPPPLLPLCAPASLPSPAAAEISHRNVSSVAGAGGDITAEASAGTAAGRKEETWTVLNVLEFNSDRKRMSVILSSPDGRILLLCKGADLTIFPLLDPSDQQLAEVRGGT